MSSELALNIQGKGFIIFLLLTNFKTETNNPLLWLPVDFCVLLVPRFQLSLGSHRIRVVCNSSPIPLESFKL